MKLRKLRKRLALGLCGAMTAGIFGGIANAAEYSVVDNYGGAQLGYSPTSGVRILNIGGRYFKDMNRNGQLDRYEDWRLTPQERAEDLAQRLSIDEIAGLMLYSMHQRKMAPELNDEQKKMLAVDNIRTVLNADTTASPGLTAQWNNALQAYAESLPFAIPANTSSDPRNDARGNGVYLKIVEDNVSRWPTHLGIAATFNPEIARDFASTYSKEYRLLGIGTGLSPQIDLATDPRWTRNYGTFGEDPALSRDMARASIYGAQETISNGVDIGWGEYSINAMMKHFPGDGIGEGGREAHSRYGKYAVYPGGAFNTQLIPFEGAMTSGGATGMPSAVMMSYSIAWSDDGSLGEKVGSAYSKFKIDLLRDRYNYDGVICTDWCVTWDTDKRLSMAWGVENISEAERHYRALMAGVDQFGGNSDKNLVIEAYRMGVAEHGESYMDRRFRESAVRLLRNIFQLGLFENPYLDVDRTAREVGNADDLRRGYEAQLSSIVMLKNINNAIHAAANSADKPTVYIPMVYRAATEVKPFNSYTPAAWTLPVDLDVVGEYFNVVTDSVGALTAVDRDGKPMAAPSDIRRLNPAAVANCDMVLAFISNPIPAGNQFDGIGYDAEQGYIPISLQYGNYVANSPAVRRSSIAGDAGENRSYYGKTAQIINPLDSESVNYSRECVNQFGRNIPVIAVIAADRPMIFSEIEPAADAILVGYGVSDRAFCDIIAGNFEPQGLIPMQQPRDMITVEEQNEDVPRDMTCYTDSEGHTYDFAFGMNWSGVISDARTAKYKVPVLK